MKTYILIALCFFTFSSISAQTNALGIRLGGGDGSQAEISYQQYIGGPNRLEFDLAFFDDGYADGFKFTLLYQWVHAIESGFNWYAGAGGSIGARDLNGHFSDDDDFNDGVFLNLDLQLGIEYNFSEVPLQLSLDARPEFGIINDDFDMGYGLGIRYTF